MEWKVGRYVIEIIEVSVPVYDTASSLFVHISLFEMSFLISNNIIYINSLRPEDAYLRQYLNYTIIGSHYVLSPVCRLAITWTSVGKLLISLWTICEISI